MNMTKALTSTLLLTMMLLPGTAQAKHHHDADASQRDLRHEESATP